MILCRLSLDIDSLWRMEQLSTNLQIIIPKRLEHFHREFVIEVLIK